MENDTCCFHSLVLYGVNFPSNGLLLCVHLVIVFIRCFDENNLHKKTKSARRVQMLRATQLHGRIMMKDMTP